MIDAEPPERDRSSPDSRGERSSERTLDHPVNGGDPVPAPRDRQRAGSRAIRWMKAGVARPDAVLVTWPVAVYALVLGLICIFLVPLTSLWWIVPVLGVAAPIALVIVAGSRAERESPELPRLTDDSHPRLSHDPGAMHETRHDLAAPVPLAEPLSEREREVLALLASGRTTSEAAHELFVSVGTIKSHTGNIYRKLGAKNRAQAITRARELGLLP